MASSPSKLWSSMHVLLESLVFVFTHFGLHINWEPGKTEAMLLFRGKNATAFQDRVLKADSYSYVNVPRTDQRLHIVDHYKHLGSKVQANGSNYFEVRRSASSAMEAFSPLCYKVFACPRCNKSLKNSKYDLLQNFGLDREIRRTRYVPIWN